MNYGKQIEQGLKFQLEKSYDIVRISRWAYNFYSDNIRYLDSSSEEILEYLFRMEDDPQFEFTEDELKQLAELLLSNEQDPLKKMNVR